MFYSSVGDRQMALGQNNSATCRNTTDSGQPVRVINNNSSAPSEYTTNYYGRPYSQQGSVTDSGDSASHLSFLYDRAQNSAYSSEIAASPVVGNGYNSRSHPPLLQNSARSPPVSPPSDYSGSIRATPAPIRQQQQHHERVSPAVLNGTRDQPVSAGGGTAAAVAPSGEYLAFSRATPAPMQQQQISPRCTGSVDRTGPQFNGIHQMASQAAAAPSRADAGTVNSPCSPSAAGLRSPVNEMSQLSLQGGSCRHPPTSVPVVGLRSRGSSTGRTLPSYARRQSAPGPVGGATGEAGSRKPWSYTPSFGVGTAAGNTGRTGPGPVSIARPVVQLTDVNGGFYKPQTVAKTSDGPKIQLNGTNTEEHDQCLGSRGSVSEGPPQSDSSTIDRSSIRYNLREGDDVGDYEQTSIRYTGKANPSKTFRMLQTVTGSDSETDAKLALATARRQARRRQPSRDELEDQLPQSDADDIVDISYVGASIPSRTFRILQEAIGERGPPVEAPPTDDVNDEGFGTSGRNIRVVHLRPMKKHSSLDNILSYTDL